MTSIPGPHHCIGASRMTTDLIFRDLNARCLAAGGSLSLAEIENARVRFLGRFPSGFELFEAIYSGCMEAGGSPAASTFSRHKILASLLQACGDKAARHTCSLQFEHFGPSWLEPFFEGIAQFVRQTVLPGADQRVIAAYVEAAGKMKSQLSFAEFLKEDGAQLVLRDCLAVLEARGAAEALAGKASSVVNQAIAAQEAIGGPDLRKVTDDQMQKFLGMLPRQMRTVLLPGVPAA
jgi:hypothetical protein